MFRNEIYSNIFFNIVYSWWIIGRGYAWWSIGVNIFKTLISYT
ncbi:unnamed protein product [Larinioides sclopetarius]|uniref:Uncharacterized protein n=1 Tax=Larinioides sclopetarius TaxID=280406 RepID=A0AAV1ZU82_9ARAC